MILFVDSSIEYQDIGTCLLNKFAIIYNTIKFVFTCVDKLS